MVHMCNIKHAIIKYPFNNNIHVPVYSEPPSCPSVVHTNSTTITVFWSPPTHSLTGYELTYSVGRTSVTVPVSGGNTDKHKIAGLDSTANYSVSIVSVDGNSKGDPTGSVLAARGELITAKA